MPDEDYLYKINGFFVDIIDATDAQASRFILYIKDEPLGGDYVYCNTYKSADEAKLHALKWVHQVEAIVKGEQRVPCD